MDGPYSQFLKHTIMNVINEPNNLQLTLNVHLVNGSVEVDNVFRNTLDVTVVKGIAMTDQMKTIVVSKNIQIKRVHVYQPFFVQKFKKKPGIWYALPKTQFFQSSPYP